MLDQLRDIVQGEPWLEIAKITGRYLKRLLLAGDPPARKPPAQCFVDDLRHAPRP